MKKIAGYLIALLMISTIPFSLVGIFFGHLIMGINLSIGSVIGILGGFGVVLNDGIVMMEFIKKTTTIKELIKKSSSRLRPIVITTLTTLIGLSTLIFFATGQSKIMQPTAVSLGFGLLWGTIVSLLYLPIVYSIIRKMKNKEK